MYRYGWFCVWFYAYMRACVLAQVYKVCRCVKWGSLVWYWISEWVCRVCVNVWMRVGNLCVHMHVWMGGYPVTRVRGSWVRGCMDAWERGGVDTWVSGCMDAWMRRCVGAWVLECMIARVRGRVGAWIGDCMWLSGAWEKRILPVSSNASKRASVW